VPIPDRTRVEAQKRAEEEAARRREQELKDLELAMQLDRELNVAEERAAAAAAAAAALTRPGMPGSW
jgi:predicted nucleic acid-binding protein